MKQENIPKNGKRGKRFGLRDVAITRLVPWPGNPRKNTDAVRAVTRSIRRFGFNVPILCDEDYNIIAGHTRLEAARALGIAFVPVIRLPLKEHDRHAFSIADNRTAQIAEWDYVPLKQLLIEIEGKEIDLCDLGFREADLRRLFAEDDCGENEIPGVAQTVISRVGDIFELDAHRLMCGDSADSVALRRLLAGEDVEHVFAGPPCFNQRGLGNWETLGAYNRDMETVMRSCKKLLKDGAVLVWHIENASSENHDLAAEHSRMLSKTGFCYLDTLAYVKTTPNYGTPRSKHIKQSGHYYPAFQWEALLVFQKPGDMPRMTPEGMSYMSTYHSNVWEIPNVINTLGHPAACPVEIPYRCLQAYTRAGATVLDPFGGSGTTLIAAEKAGRRGFLLEKNPAFCDVIVQRWENMTGKKAKHRPAREVCKR
jgi:DNA modification methylase